MAAKSFFIFKSRACSGRLNTTGATKDKITPIIIKATKISKREKPGKDFLNFILT
jgi:hypothetical protein